MRTKTASLAYIALMTAVLVVCAMLVLPLGPVPFSMALFGVVVAGGMLPPLQAVACVAVYLLLGAAGLPVFAGFRGGLAVLAGATGGYLLGYIPLAGGVSIGARRFKKLLPRVLCALPGLAVLYLLGTGWLAQVAGLSFLAALQVGTLPFILPDIAKIVLGLWLAGALQKRMKK